MKPAHSARNALILFAAFYAPFATYCLKGMTAMALKSMQPPYPTVRGGRPHCMPNVPQWLERIVGIAAW